MTDWSLYYCSLCEATITFKQTCTVVQHKKMRSTLACTPFFTTFSLNIHVGCCLFSHNILKNTKNKKLSVVMSANKSQRYLIIYNIAQLCNTNKKIRSTHACTPSLATFSPIFTSVVVYSRTSKVHP